MNTIIILFFVVVALRLISLVKSAKNEKRLVKQGAVEYGRKNSMALVLVITLYYISCITEAVLLKKTANSISYIGAALAAFSMIMLLVVIVGLKDIWTVKVYILPNQRINKSFLFKYIRHPNYFLNVIPELVALAMICQAWYTLMIGLPVCLIPLTIRIVQEERAMKEHFSDY
jgi:isoprenylcysteine carboxyl methyltransferase (ICMT) family protein YpbQ